MKSHGETEKAERKIWEALRKVKASDEMDDFGCRDAQRGSFIRARDLRWEMVYVSSPACKGMIIETRCGKALVLTGRT